jgi:SPX domain protein involved in polyphosphate accumulation
MKRQEEKYFLSQSEVALVLSSYGAYPIYPIRQINSIYFDSQDFESFTDSEEGVVPRRKYRFRWYGDAGEIATSGMLETKITMEHHREKTSRSFSFNSFPELAESFRDASSSHLRPVCQVSYRRAYFGNSSGLRFTYDFDLITQTLDRTSFKKIPRTVLEIKYSSEVPSAQFASLLGDRKTRFSKYNEAVQTLRLL